MDTFRNMTIGARLGIGFGVLLVALCVTSALGVAGMSRIGALADRVINEDWERSNAAHVLEAHARATFVVALQTLQKTEQTPFTVLKERVTKAQAGMDAAMARLTRLAPLAADKSQLGKIEADRKAYLQALAEVMTLAEAGQVVHGEAAVHRSLEPRFSALARSVGGLVEQNKAQAARSGEAHMAAISAARWTSGLLWVFSLGGGTLFAWWLVRSLTVPLAQAVSAAQRISAGQLDVAIEARGGDEVAALLRALASMQAELRAMIGGVAQSAAEVSTAASQLACAAVESNARAQVCSEVTGSTAAAIEEMTASIGQVAEHAQDAAAIAGRSSQLAREGEAIVRAASGEMRSIAQSVKHGSDLVETLNRRSGEISSIVKVIKDIADQTNLLALNAAIEAARAGEQGRGFAVVADEVRKLAERTGGATSEIGAMIEAIQQETASVVATMQSGGDKVAKGVKLADDAAAALEKINAQTLEAVAGVNAIAAATREQQAASSDIARNVERIAQMTEEGGASSNHNADSARHLERLSAGLQTRIARFTL